MNAVSHREYRHPGSVFVRQFSRRVEMVSPGGFPPGITAENILWKQSPRNRRIAEAFGRCGLVERSGQGANLMFEECIKESKPKPDFTWTDDYQVFLTLRGEIQDPRFLRFLEQVGRERLELFSTPDLLVLDLVFREERVPAALGPRLGQLAEQGIIESVGRGRGVRYLLSRKFHDFLGRTGAYTRKRGLDRDTNKALLLKHIQDSGQDGSPLQDLMQVLPSHSRNQVQSLLKELKLEGRTHPEGRTRNAKWLPGPSPLRIASKTQ